MSNVLIFDPFNGTAGDMICGALLDMGMPLTHLQSELNRINLGGYSLSAEKIERQGLFGIDFKVLLDSEKVEDHSHSHGGHQHQKHHHHHRGFSEIVNLIESSSLDDWVKENSVRIFRRLAEAEASVHQSTPDEVHFHEVGAIDSIVDIVGACIGFKYFEIKRFYTTALNLGGGTVSFSHGTWPVPAPATAELIRGFPSRIGTISSELTTPTGAAIVTTLSNKVSKIPPLLLDRSGFGAGDKEFSQIPNMLRLMLGKLENGPQPHGSGSSDGVSEEEVVVFEATVDDMDGESWGHFLERAFQEGALDVYFTPVQMKKNRPGVLVSILCQPADQERLAAFIFRETTTLGLRKSITRRLVLDRETRKLDTQFGEVRIKIGRFKGQVANLSPEFEDLRRIAKETGLPFKVIKQKLMDDWEDNLL